MGLEEVVERERVTAQQTIAIGSAYLVEAARGQSCSISWAIFGLLGITCLSGCCTASNHRRPRASLG